MGGEQIHLVVFFLRPHPSVNICHPEIRERLPYILISLFQTDKVKFFILFNKRIYYVCLTASRQLLEKVLVHLQPLVVVTQQGHDWLSSRRKLIYYRYVEVTINGHRQCAWYRGCRHYQYVWQCGRIFIP